MILFFGEVTTLRYIFAKQKHSGWAWENYFYCICTSQ